MALAVALAEALAQALAEATLVPRPAPLARASVDCSHPVFIAHGSIVSIACLRVVCARVLCGVHEVSTLLSGNRDAPHSAIPWQCKSNPEVITRYT